jgi:cytochrome c oxidase subunit 2
LRGGVPLLAVALLVGGCSDETEAGRLAVPEPASRQGQFMLDLWQGAWIAAIITGIVVWGLIFYAVVRFRRRSDDEIPIQTRYNLPLEIFYTLAPVVMVIVFFNHTIQTQNDMLEDDRVPDVIVEVTGQQWQWTFNHGLGELDNAADDDRGDDEFAYDEYAFVVGTGNDIPTLVLPVDSRIRFNLHSPDVIHDFGVPAFGMKMDVIPGRVNHYVIDTTREGLFAGKCYELCGTYHSRMLFNVEVVSAEEYQDYLEELESGGDVSEKPLLGGENANTAVGEETTPEDPEGEGK